MLPYVQKINRIKDRNMVALGKARQLFTNLPERSDGEWTCHGLVEALYAFLEEEPSCKGFWKPVHGYFTIGFRHSWLHNTTDQAILDPYPVACGSGPLLITLDGKSPWHTFFIKGGEE